MFSIRGIIYYLIYMINGPKWSFFTILPLFELQWGLIFFYFTYSMSVGQKLLIEKILENIFFMEINIFGIFDQKPFWRTPIFEPTRAILLRRVRYAEFQPEGLVPYPSQQNGSSGFFFDIAHFFYQIKKYRKYKKIVFPND